jgi:DNA-binding NarL/FixJ family response regulator
MAENECIFLAESDFQVRDVMRLFLERDGHTVVLQTGDMEEATQAMLNADFTVAVIGDDNNAIRDLTNKDSKVLAEEFRKAVPEIIIVSFSALPGNTFGDINVSKQIKPPSYNPFAELAKAVTAIPPRNPF